MAYIRKKYRRLLEISDKQFTIPKSFASLVERFALKVKPQELVGYERSE